MLCITLQKLPGYYFGSTAGPSSLVTLRLTSQINYRLDLLDPIKGFSHSMDNLHLEKQFYISGVLVILMQLETLYVESWCHWNQGHLSDQSLFDNYIPNYGF